MRGTTPPGRLHAWARVLRAPNLLTVPGDPLAGAFLAASHGMGIPLLPVLAAMAAAILFYAAGLLLNDWVDLAEDKRDRPERPLPSGAIAPRHALAAAVICTVGGLLAASAAGRPALIVGTGLMILILAYNFVAKATRAGCWVMGGCRAFSLFMGASVLSGASPLAQARVAGAASVLLLYVAMVTRAARSETSPRRNANAALPAAVTLVLGGIALSALLPAPGAPAAWPAGLLAILWATVGALRWRNDGPAAIGALLGALPFWQAFLAGASGAAASGRTAMVLMLAGFLSACWRRRVAAS